MEYSTIRISNDRVFRHDGGRNEPIRARLHVYGEFGGPTQAGLESTMSPSTPLRARIETDARRGDFLAAIAAQITPVDSDVERSRRRAVSAACWALLRLAHSNGMPTLFTVSQVSMMRAAATGVAGVGPLIFVDAQPPPVAGVPDAVPVSKQEASQLAMLATLITPAVSIKLFAVTVPVQSLGL
jgi:hypothetical protein